MPLLGQAVENLRLLSENCSSLQGFMITHSFGGGTGSGFTARFLDEIASEYGGSKSKSEIRIHFSSSGLLTKLLFISNRL